MKSIRKRGMALNTIVMFVIALVVLFVVLFIFRDQIGRALKGYTRVSEETGELLEGVKCQTILGDRTCESGDNCPEGTKKVNLPVNKTWKDCPSGQICCEEVY